MTRMATIAAAVAIAVALLHPPAQAQNTEQVIFSGTGTGTFSLNGGEPHASPVGFWIWCQVPSTNPYSPDCNGAMYFYYFGITRPVGGTVGTPVNGVVTMTVASRFATIFACTLTNGAAPTSGPTNTVTVNCGSAATPTLGGLLNGTGTSTNSVVQITGP
jgi:hypothetical protein